MWTRELYLFVTPYRLQDIYEAVLLSLGATKEGTGSTLEQASSSKER